MESSSVTYKDFRKEVDRIHNEFKKLEPIRKAITHTLDIMFILDCTGSMRPWIESCKKEIRAIIDSLK